MRSTTWWCNNYVIGFARARHFGLGTRLRDTRFLRMNFVLCSKIIVRCACIIDDLYHVKCVQLVIVCEASVHFRHCIDLVPLSLLVFSVILCMRVLHLSAWNYTPSRKPTRRHFMQTYFKFIIPEKNWITSTQVLLYHSCKQSCFRVLLSLLVWCKQGLSYECSWYSCHPALVLNIHPMFIFGPGDIPFMIHE